MLNMIGRWRAGVIAGLLLNMLAVAGIAQTWTQVPGALNVISASPDGTAVWGINIQGNFYRWNSAASGWDAMHPVPLSPAAQSALQPATGTPPLPASKVYDLAVASTNDVTVTDLQAGLVFRWTGATWRLAQGYVAGLTVGVDGVVRGLAGGAPVQLTSCVDPSGQFVTDDWKPLPAYYNPIFVPLRRISGNDKGLFGVIGNMPGQFLTLQWTSATNQWVPSPGVSNNVADMRIGSDGTLVAQDWTLGFVWRNGFSWAPLPLPAGLQPLQLVSLAYVNKSNMWALDDQGRIFRFQ